MIYSTISVLFASLASPAANAFTSSPILYGLDTHKPSVSLSAVNNLGIAQRIRFEKFPLTKEAKKREISFPLQPNDAKWLKKNTEADSVIIRDDFRLSTTDIEKYLGDFKPLYPNDERFWEQFRVVVDAQKKRRERQESEQRLGLTDDLYIWPKLWLDRKESKIYPWKDKSNRNLNLDDVAQSVKGEFSNYHQQDAITRAIANMSEGKRDEFHDLGQFDDENVIPERDFIAFQVRAAVINAWSLEVVAATNFFLKWYYGVPRPEEVAWKIKKDDLGKKQGVPQDVIDDVKSLNLNSAADFTAYDEGCPTHPSFPAMHSAGSTCSTWFPALYNIDPEDYLQLLRMDYAVSFARTVAGVHYPQDNLAGLNIGQRIVREKLPGFLAENYGYDAGKVKKRLDDLEFDWNDYDNKNGTLFTEYDADGEFMKVKNATDFFIEANDKLNKRNNRRSSTNDS